jgi:hypothetical protein
MQIPAQSNIPAVEDALTILAHAPEGEPLKLPSNLRYLAGGAEAALTQLVVTWAQKNPKGTLQTFLETSDQIDAFVRRLPGLVAALCTNRATNRQGTEAIQGPLRGAAIARLNRLQSQKPKDAFRGPSVEVLCADHLGKDAPFLLYMPESRGISPLRPRENFKDLAAWLLRKTIQGSYREAVPVEASEAIGGMLYEIFKNTEDHALSDVAGDLLDVSIRAIKTNHHAMVPEQMAQVVGGYSPLSDYCNKLPVPEGAAFTHLFELSILDSGPGFASTWTGKPVEALSIEEEERAVIHCFGEGSAKRSDRFGQGLPHVLRLLSAENGFLRLRTGRLSFYIDFSQQEHASPNALRRFNPAGSLRLAPVSGSLLTVLLPMRRPS